MLVPTRSLDASFEQGLQLAFPPVMVQLLQALLEPSPSFSAISKFLNMDPMLAGRVLHIVNTASYAFSQQITDLRRAALAMGTRELFKLVIALSLQKRLNPAGKREPDLIYGDWRITLWSALASEAIAERICPGKSQSAYLLGILKDLPLFLALSRDDAPDFLSGPRLVTLPSQEQFAGESACWGRTHQEMARDIFVYWGFPEEFNEVALAHHDYEHVASLQPLARAVVHGTRWAELLLGPGVEPSRLVSFEFGLAVELGMSNDEQEKFRADLAAKFNTALGQLGIKKTSPETRLYDQPLADIQGYYFLALGAIGGVTSYSALSMAAELKRQLMLFWGISTWEISLILPWHGEDFFYRCPEGETGEQALPKGRVRPGWVCLSIDSGQARYGHLALPAMPQGDKRASLPMFLRMLAVHLEEYAVRYEKCTLPEKAELPFVTARLDESGRIMNVSREFLDTFSLKNPPVGENIRDFLHSSLGLTLPRFDAGEFKENPSIGWLLSGPEGSFPGTPVYVGLRRTAASGTAKDDESGQGGPDIAGGALHLILGDITSMTQTQSLGLAHPDILESLFGAIDKQICILDENGVVLWSAQHADDLLGKSIFAVSLPVNFRPELWNRNFLARLEERTELTAMVISGGITQARQLIFTPLRPCANIEHSQYLLIIKKYIQAGTTQEGVKSRDYLTGLYGYSQFQVLLEHVSGLARKQRLPTGILFCDVDQMHAYNERHGYKKGDLILRQVAECLNSSCRPGQDYPCRYSSAKFAVIVSRGTADVLNGMAANIHHLINERCHGEIKLNLGLALVSPGDPPRARLAAARAGSVKASADPRRTCWGE